MEGQIIEKERGGVAVGGDKAAEQVTMTDHWKISCFHAHVTLGRLDVQAVFAVYGQFNVTEFSACFV